MSYSLLRRAALLFALLSPLSSYAVEMVLTSEVAASHWKTKYMNEFAQDVAKRTNGAVQVKVFPASQLYNDQDGLAAIGTGAVHMVWPVSVRLETLDAGLGYVNLPFGLSDKLMENQCFASGLTELISDRLKSRQLQVLGLLRTADLFFIFRDRDVKSLADMQGAKLRVTGGRIFLDMVRSFDASPVSMAASEMSTALAQGAIDGVLTSPAGWAEMIGKTGKYAFHVPGMSLATYAVVVDRNWMDALPADQRQAVVDSLNDIIKRQWDEARAADAKAVKQMEAQGSVYRVADDAAAAEWKARADTAKKVYTDKYGDVVKQVDAIAQGCGV
ncbi:MULTISPECIES: TRAP transporter substrate-binding protein DctP [Bordetella]|jgi:TRAP-type C4-dicarboxylate transport system substrate-binding protein|uniref:C4-dicarboxylate ABC transporter substrate-binding protein n=1 Tax=Bordetella genomosp. 7 TaxID=1416805 RepID=A0A261RIA3_9BORD|nr:MULTISPECIES: TRAP transporter substrate-binding protein DctP [Bordetella]OZI24527.1 C4-dicarboxylate ABC transporter substrate-binding protein [Bordetella genomosp. 7]